MSVSVWDAKTGKLTSYPTKESAPSLYSSVSSVVKSSGSSSKSSGSSAAKPAKGFDISKEAKKLKKDEEDRKKAAEKAAKERIGKAFDPIFGELDRQLAALPGRKATYEQEIGRLAEEQRATAETERAKSKAALETSKGQVAENAQASLRDLEGDIRNQLKARVNALGAASQSSAATEVSEAVSREGMKSRAKILSTRDQAYAAIEQQAADIDSLATEQIGKIDAWKASTLFEIGQDFADKFDALQREKANATADEARAIDERITGLEQDFYGRLRQIDDSVLSYKSSIATWQMQRQAELEDYGKKLAMSASYQGMADDAEAYKAANAVFEQSLSQGLNVQDAQNRAFQQTGVDPLKGLQLTDETIEQIKKRAAAGLSVFSQDALGNPVVINKNDPAAGYTPIPQAGAGAGNTSSNSGGGLLNTLMGLLSNK